MTELKRAKAKPVKRVRNDTPTRTIAVMRTSDERLREDIERLGRMRLALLAAQSIQVDCEVDAEWLARARQDLEAVYAEALLLDWNIRKELAHRRPDPMGGGHDFVQRKRPTPDDEPMHAIDAMSETHVGLMRLIEDAHGDFLVGPAGVDRVALLAERGLVVTEEVPIKRLRCRLTPSGADWLRERPRAHTLYMSRKGYARRQNGNGKRDD